ncbi:acyltransferase family protein [Nostoc linckia FACHB-104]|nr:acyltransferase family protein [Nostoc linckia FACHB-104]
MQHNLATTWFLNHDITKLVVDNPLSLNGLLFAVFTALTINTFRKTLDDKPLSILQTNQMKGLSMIIIIIHHLSIHSITNPSDLLIFRNTGFIGVTLFLILSGFGLCLSMQKKGIENFFKRRLSKIYLPFLFAMLLEVVLRKLVLYNANNIFTELSNLVFNVTSVDRNMWFIIFILFWYGITYLIFRLNLSTKLKIFFLCFVSIAILLIPQIPEFWKINAFSFPLGCWIGLNYQDISPKIQKVVSQRLGILWAMIIGFFILSIVHLFLAYISYEYGAIATDLLFIIIAIILLLFLAKKKVGVNSYIETICGLLTTAIVGLNYLNISSDYNIAGHILRNMSGIFSAGAIFLLVSLMVKFNTYSVFLNWIGDIAFELYLLHGMFMYSFDFILFRGNISITFFIYFIVICLASIIFKKLNSVFYSSILNKL